MNQNLPNFWKISNEVELKTLKPSNCQEPSFCNEACTGCVAAKCENYALTVKWDRQIEIEHFHPKP